MDDITLRNAVIEELAQAAHAHASSATVKENLTVGSGEAVADEPSTDREALAYLMRAFDTESWQCQRCGHDEDCATMDSAFFLLDYLRAHPAPSAEDARDAERFRFIVEYNWLGTKTRCDKGIKDSDIVSARQAIDQALAAERGEGK